MESGEVELLRCGGAGEEEEEEEEETEKTELGHGEMEGLRSRRLCCEC